MEKAELSDIIAIIALIVSLVTAFYGFCQSSKLNKINLKATIFESIFWKLLFEEYLDLFNKINEWNIEEEELDELEEFIIKLKYKLDIYKNVNKKFYSNSIMLLKELDDLVVTYGDNKVSENVPKKMCIVLKKIYSSFLEEYLN